MAEVKCGKSKVNVQVISAVFQNNHFCNPWIRDVISSGRKASKRMFSFVTGW